MNILQSLIGDIQSWARGNVQIHKIYIAGSQARASGTKEYQEGSDVDILVFLSPGADESSIYTSLSSMGLKHALLIHPLIFSSEDCDFKLSIHEYKKMLSTAEIIYDSVLGK